MSKFAVGHFFDNDLIIEIVEASDWYDAIWNHSKMQLGDDEPWLSNKSLQDAKMDAFDCDMMIDVVEIK